MSFKRLIKPPLRIQPRGNLISLDVKSVTSLVWMSINYHYLFSISQYLTKSRHCGYLPCTPDTWQVRDNWTMESSLWLSFLSYAPHLYISRHNINGIVVRQNVGINKLSAMAYLAFYKKWHEAYLRSNSFTTCPAASYDHGAAKVLILTKLQCPGSWMVQASIERNNEISDRVSGLSPCHRDTSHSTGHWDWCRVTILLCKSQLKN